MVARGASFALTLALVGCTVTPPSVAPSEYGSIRYRLIEEAGPDHVPIPEAGYHYVDPDSRLLIDLEPTHLDTPAEPRVAWTILNELLTELEALASERNELLASDAPPEERRRARQAFNQRVFDFFLTTFDDALAKLEPRDEDLFDRVFTGRFQPGLDPAEPYVNVALWLRERLEKEDEEAARLAARGEEEEIGILAFHRTPGKTWTRMPVYNYDEIASTGADEKDNSILSLSPADRARLASELEQATRAKNVLTNLRAEIGELRDWRAGVVNAMRAELEGMAELLTEGPEGWAAILVQVAERCEGLQLAEGSTALDKRAAAVAALRTFAADLDELARVADAVRRVVAAVAAGGEAGVGEALFGSGGLVEGLGELLRGLQGLRARVDAWEAGRLAIGEFMDALEPGARLELLPDSMREPLFAARARVQPALDRLAEMAESLSFDVGGDGKQTVDGLALLAEAEVGDGVAFHLARSAPDGIVRLDDADVSEGDDLLVQIVARPRGSDESRHIVAQYQLEARELGPHARLSADAILARASTGEGDATEWKPSVAVSWSLHHRFRDPNRSGRAFNWIHPGIGVHAASLDQDDDSVEFGLGVSLTVFDGLLTGGVGYNLNREEDRGYFLVGTSLFKLLGQLAAIGGEETSGN
jgi:hypothetical protein